MTQMRRQSLTAYGTPLCETVADAPQPKGSEVLVRIARCGVCHSDLHMQDGYFLLGDGKQLDVRAGRTLPFTLGHEIAGVIDSVGPEADVWRRAISASRWTAASPRMCWCRIRAT
jgi:D-arabinose 1-dehydrogenase-like Zn-dependent alcohol dehydrogenase